MLSEGTAFMTRLFPTIQLDKDIAGAGLTVMGAVTVVMPVKVTLRFAEPWATPVTPKPIESCPAGTVTAAGTVATDGVSEARLNVIPPAGAGAEIVNVSMTVRVALTEMEGGVTDAVTVTVTAAVSGANPVAVAVTCVEPMVTPVTCGFADGMNKPAGTKTLGVIV